MTIPPDTRNRTEKPPRRRGLKPWGFLLAVIALYAGLAPLFPHRVLHALRTGGYIMARISLPISVAFLVMTGVNLFVKPGRMARLLGERSGIRGVFLSSLAGALSMGPIYAWYPLLKGLRDRGVSGFHLANFLCSRSVRPVLLPVMIFYFGWAFSLTLSALMLAASVVTAYLVSLWGEPPA